MRLKFTFSIVIGIFAMNAFSQKIITISSTSTERWMVGKSKILKDTQPQSCITIYTDSCLQDVVGFGGTFNELGWDAMQCLSTSERDKIMAALFSEEGIHFSLGRTPIGASDYAFAYYSYNDVKDDYTMRNFSIARDRYTLIPYIKEALKVRPDLKLWASPWTPPAWMKINEHYALKSRGLENTDVGHNLLDPKRSTFKNVTAFNMQDGYLQAYALYFSRYIQEYKKNGVDIQMIMPQNEIAWQPAWPSCTWRPEDLGIFVSYYLGPQFEKDAIDTQIWLGTINYPNPDYIRTFLKLQDARKYIKGIGIQWTGKQALPVIYKEYPQYSYMQTENECGNGENDWSSLETSWKAIVHCFNNGVGSYMYWNMVLDETGKSGWDWSQNSLIIVDRKTKQVRYTDEFYLMKHLSHFLPPDCHLLKVSNGTNTLAFTGKNGRVVIVVYNPEEEEMTQYYRVGDSSFSALLKAKSLNTFIVEGK